MTNFQINFSYPLLLLLIIPAVFFTFFSYFRLNKKYRKNRNRIISIVFHLTALTLSIFALAGLNFSYDEPNTENEMILLVDASYSNTLSEQAKDEYVKSVIDTNKYNIKLGIVTFGYNQVCASPLSYDMNEVYNNYLMAESPDDSATDIASALIYAKSLFKNPQSAKIILLTDGVETDGSSMSVIKQVSSSGIIVDVVNFLPEKSGNELQIIGVEMPNVRIEENKPIEVSVTLQSSYSGDANIILYDNDKKVSTTNVQFEEGTNIFKVGHTFVGKELHALHFAVESSMDTLKVNNDYYTYLYLEDFNRILIVERVEGDSEDLKTMLSTKVVAEGEVSYDITTVCVTDINNMPKTTNELRGYDEVILVNIAHADMPVYDNGETFENILNDYVYNYGGGMFTVGGNSDELDDNGNLVANTYDRDDMFGTVYQDMLPVEAIDYTPPAGVMIIIDWSGSMSVEDAITGKTYLQLAKEGARAAVNAMTERDYCGIVSLEDSYKEEIKPIPLPRKEELMATIDNLGEDVTGGGTVYQGAIEQAGAALKKLTTVEKKHIILISDGMPSDSFDDYGTAVQSNIDAGITMSIVVVGHSPNKEIEKATELGKGNCYHNALSEIPEIMRTELELPLIKAVNHEPFNAEIDKTTAVTKNITQADLNEVELGGFYGTKIKQGADQVLKGTYVPLYAQWVYGKGKVGSFMCDLNSTDWSKDFIESGVGKVFINNVVGELFPIFDISAPDIEVSVIEDNYNTQVNIYPTSTNKNTSFEVSVKSPVADAETGSNVQSNTLEGANTYRKTSFEIKQPGIHEIIVKQNEEGQLVATCLTYKSFSYSKEYNMFFDLDTATQLINDIALNGKGKVITNSDEAFIGFETVIHIVYSPIVPFMIIALTLFLLDIAVRKFKFKWIHELVRDYKAKKLLEKK